MMICDTCKAIDFLPLDEHRDKADIVRDRKNEAFLFTPPDFHNDPEIRQWRDGHGTTHGYYFHHDTGSALLESAQSGCFLCAVMSFALFEDSVSNSEFDLNLRNMPKSQYPVVLATVLHPDHRHWRVNPKCHSIRAYCGTHESKLDIITVDKGMDTCTSHDS